MVLDQLQIKVMEATHHKDDTHLKEVIHQQEAIHHKEDTINHRHMDIVNHQQEAIHHKVDMHNNHMPPLQEDMLNNHLLMVHQQEECIQLGKHMEIILHKIY